MRWAPLGLAVASIALLAGCGAGGRRVHGSVGVTPAGQIGPLHVDRSSRGDVLAAFGRPDAENKGRYSNYAPFDALGYGCKGAKAVDKAGVPACQTVFYLLGRTGKLALMYTEDSRFVLRGVHPGTPTAAAARTLHQRPGTGCYTGFRFATKTGFAVLWHYGRGPGRVGLLAVHSPRLDVRDNPGVLDCIDS